MIIDWCEQNTPEWLIARSAIPTASAFDKILTPGFALSKQSEAYLGTLIGEWISGSPDNTYQSDDMITGHEREPDARSCYELICATTVEQPGFVYRDEKKLSGCSPDGLVRVGDEYERGLEIKCPQKNTHLGYRYLNDCPNKYILQVQGGMWITGLEKWDFMSYHPQYAPFITTVYRNEKAMKAIGVAVGEFVDRLLTAREIPWVVEERARRIERQQHETPEDLAWQ